MTNFLQYAFIILKFPLYYYKKILKTCIRWTVMLAKVSKIQSCIGVLTVSKELTHIILNYKIINTIFMYTTHIVVLDSMSNICVISIKPSLKMKIKKMLFFSPRNSWNNSRTFHWSVLYNLIKFSFQSVFLIRIHVVSTDV